MNSGCRIKAAMRDQACPARPSRAGRRATRPRRRLALEPLEERRLLTVIELSSLLPDNGGDGSQGFVLEGAGADDRSGFSVSSAGDMNGDGFDDLIIGAVLADQNGEDSGKSYVVFGKSDGFAPRLQLEALDGSDGFAIHGIYADDRAGFSVDGAGDVNGDGFDDVILGSLMANDYGQNAGRAYVVFGQGSAAANVELFFLDGSDGFTLPGADPGDLAGYSVSGAGDVNGDGFQDLIIGAHRADPDNRDGAGASYVVFGKAGGFPAFLPLASLDGTDGFTIEGSHAEDQSGISVSSAGDVNGDGFDDLILGASGADPNGNGSAGESYVLFGKNSAYPARWDLSSLDGQNGFVLEGIAIDDYAGYSVSSAGDVNGDGLDDLLIGAFASDETAASAGQSYLLYGRSSGFPARTNLAMLDGTSGSKINGASAQDLAGHSVAAAGDINGDGLDDLLIGASGASPAGNTSAGTTYVIFGRTGGLPATVNLSSLGTKDALIIHGIDSFDVSGRSVHSAGDVNGDGFDDLIIGARYADPLEEAAGESYLLFGQDFTGAVTQQGDNADNVLVGDASANVMVAGAGDDVLLGWGGPDVLRGGAGDDILTVTDTSFQRLVGGNGNDTLLIDGADLTLDLTSMPDNRILAVESIDLRGAGQNTLRLVQRDVLRISDTSNTLTVRADRDDTVQFGAGWLLDGQTVVEQEAFYVIKSQAATLQLSQAHSPNPWYNLANPADINNNGTVTPADILAIVSELTTNGVHQLPPMRPEIVPPFLDPHDDLEVTLQDVLAVVLILVGSSGAGNGEGEAEAEPSGNAAGQHWQIAASNLVQPPDSNVLSAPLAERATRTPVAQAGSIMIGPEYQLPLRAPSRRSLGLRIHALGGGPARQTDAAIRSLVDSLELDDLVISIATEHAMRSAAWS